MNNIVSWIKNEANRFKSAYTRHQIVLLLCCAAIFSISAVYSLAFSPGKRYLFYFPAVNGESVQSEVRFLPPVHGTEARLALFLDELLLGPRSPELDPLFERGTSVVSCLFRQGDAYVNLSKSALSFGIGNEDPKKVYILFKKNVCTNFRNVDRIYLYVDGIEVFRETPGIAEAEK